ncbi:MAG: hypothetical protein EXQ47_11955 [Bryobacterales bacterium]|nr:hypothetical protein [Bryobacterales bacterium]
MNFRRAVAFLVYCCLWFAPGWAQVTAPDPAFQRVPFNQWLEEGGPGPFHWSARVSGGVLSNHQRLRARVEVTIDGGDLASRLGDGYLIMMVQIEDADHRVYQTHRGLNLQRISKEAAKSNIVYTQDVFVRPGDYRAGIVIFDSTTGEHGAALKTLHVNPPKNDSLPDAWLDLPAVEFVPAMDLPESLYLPNSGARLRLPLESRRSLHVELMVNASPTRAQEGLHSGAANNRYLIELLPALKVMSQLRVRKGGMRVSLLDLTRRRVVFEQAFPEPDKPAYLRWMRLRRGLIEADPNKIDVRALEHREQNAQFFVEQIRERVLEPAEPESAKPLRIGIVLSGPMGFESGEDLRPIAFDNKSEYKIYVFRHHLLPLPQLPILRGRRNIPLPPRFQEPLDSLVSLIKPLRPRVFDIYNPDQFRKALAAMLDEISRL